MEKMERKNRKWRRDRGRKRREMREEGQWKGETEVRVSRERIADNGGERSRRETQILEQR